MSRHNIRLALPKKGQHHEQYRYPRRARPGKLLLSPGSLAHLNDFFTPEQLSRAVWIYGERAIEGARPFLPESFNAAGAKHLLFKGHCSERDVTHLVNESGDDAAW
jgi:uncharacterized oxidoreductase